MVGLARSVREPERPAARHIESIWVAPTHRRRGVLRALVQGLAERERLMGVTDLLLWVLEDNYRRAAGLSGAGFEPTGDRQFLPDFRQRRLRVAIRHLLESEFRPAPFERRLLV